MISRYVGQFFLVDMCRIFLMSDQIDPDQMLHSIVSVLSLHCLSGLSV